MKKLRYFLRYGVAVCLLVQVLVLSCSADMSFKSYTYDWWGDAKECPLPYDYETRIDGVSLDTQEFVKLSDIAIYNGCLYILDGGSNRIVVVNSRYEYVRTIDTFINNGQQDGFQQPQGLFITNDGLLYVADTENNRIVKMTVEGRFQQEFGRPDTVLLDSEYAYRPSKLAVDRYGRIYVLALAVTDGLVELDESGNFVGFFGANEVSMNMTDYIWRFFMSEEQWAARALYLPTEFSNVTLDSQGFVYVTTSAMDLNSSNNNTMPVKRLNLSGDDVLRCNGYVLPVGDINGRALSSLVDIAVGESTYSILDSTYGRIFTYDNDGNLLYAFGDKGNYNATLQSPVAIEYFGNRIVVADSMLNKVVVYNVTGYGETVNAAIQKQQDGQYEAAADLWKRVLEYNGNLDLAYIGIGKIHLMNGEYEQAMDCFKLAQARKYYSKAFKLQRKEKLAAYIPAIGMTLIVLFILVACLSVRKRIFGFIRRVCADENVF